MSSLEGASALRIATLSRIAARSTSTHTGWPRRSISSRFNPVRGDLRHAALEQAGELGGMWREDAGGRALPERRGVLGEGIERIGIEHDRQLDLLQDPCDELFLILPPAE